MDLPDIQNSHDPRGIPIDQVGVSNLRLPVRFDDGEMTQQGIATASVTVQLPAEARGTHMSRMVQHAEQMLADFDPRALGIPMKVLAVALDADVVQLAVELPVSTIVKAPVSGILSAQVSDVCVRADYVADSCRVTVSVSTDITTLCPCSQAVSDYGAHNQRSRVTVAVEGAEADPYPCSASELIALVRSVGSAPVVPVIKRPDERHLTMMAFDKPSFVEDVVRDLSSGLRARNLSHSVISMNIESIHSHDAVARLTWTP